jgi:hypothetical protein
MLKNLEGKTDRKLHSGRWSFTKWKALLKTMCYTQRKKCGEQPQLTRASHLSGVDVMITIFCDFWKFSAKKLAFLIKKQCYDQNFA